MSTEKYWQIYKEAKADFQKALLKEAKTKFLFLKNNEQYPKLVDGFLALIHFYLNEYKELLTLVAKYEKNLYEVPKLIYAYVKYLWMQGKFNEAVETLKENIPKVEDILYKLLLLKELKSFSKIDFYEVENFIKEDNFRDFEDEIELERAEYLKLFLNGKIFESINAMKNILKKQVYFESFIDLVEILKYCFNFSEALKVLSDIKNLGLKSHWLDLLEISILYSMKKYKEVSKKIRSLLSVFPKNYRLWYMLSVIEGKLGNVKEEIKSLEKCTNLADGNYVYSMSRLAYVYQRNGYLFEAIKIYEELLEKREIILDEGVYYNFVIAYIMLEQLDKAYIILKKFSQLGLISQEKYEKLLNIIKLKKFSGSPKITSTIVKELKELMEI